MTGQCRHCRAYADEDGYPDCDCGEPQTTCENCDRQVLERRLLSCILPNHTEKIFCDSCEDGVTEEILWWWWEMTEIYEGLLQDIKDDLLGLEYENANAYILNDNR